MHGFDELDAALAVAGWLDLLGSVVLVGGLLYGGLVAAPSQRGARSMRTAILLVVIGLLLEFGFTALRMKDVSDVRGLRLLVDLVQTRWGTLWLLRAFGLVVFASRTRIAAVAAPPWLLLRSLQGHPGAHGIGPALVDGLHFAAAAAWIGGLVQLALAGPAVPVVVAQRMRTVATAAVAVVLPAGMYGALLHVHSWRMLVGTPYGRTLMLKLALVPVLLALGAANHFRHVPAVARGEAAAGAHLGRNVRTEIVLAAAVLLCSALLGVLPMPHVHPG